VRAAVERKAEAELALLLAEIPGLPPLARNAVVTLPRLTGEAAVLAHAETICLNTTMMQALSDLRAVADLLRIYGVETAVAYDLAEVRDLDYYTGVTFEGFAPGLGFSLVSGGRYDDLIGHFGPPLAAVGWALTLDRVLLARELQGIGSEEPRSDLLLSASVWAANPQWAAQARLLGVKVEIDPLGLDPEALWQAALGRAIPRIVYGADLDHLTVRDAAGRRSVTREEWQEVTRWLNR
jgi:ATP phosphoribosyltransferase regulatory subunit